MTSTLPLAGASPAERKTRFLALRTAQQVADLLGVKYGWMCHVLYAKPGAFRYTIFHVPKRNGTLRTISKPHPAVRSLQARLLPFLVAAYGPKPSAHGFVQERDIVSNARPHVGKRYVLNVDLADFFPSIHFGRVRGMLMGVPYRLPSSVASVLARICCYDGVLPQGAPTSPIISNMICAKMDSELQRLAARHRCTYSRYADDLTFSTTGRRFPEQLAVPRHGLVGENLHLGESLVSAIEANGFRVNTEKQRLQPSHHRQEVTGVTVNRFLNPRKRLVRQVRAMLHAWRKYGLQAATADFYGKFDRRARLPGAPRPSFIRVVLGKIEHIRNVGGDGHPGYRKLLSGLHVADSNYFAAPANATTWNPRAPDTSRWARIAKKFRRSVFHLEVTTPKGDLQNGTAFVWDTGFLATADHNLIGELSILVDGSKVKVAELDQLRHPNVAIGVDAALLRVPSNVTEGRLPFKVRMEPVDLGEPVAALGYPTVPMYDASLIVREGLVEGTAPQYNGKVDAIQVSVKLTGGFSGGPVVDSTGLLVGVVVEATYEKTADGVPGGSFQHVQPAKYLGGIPKL